VSREQFKPPRGRVLHLLGNIKTTPINHSIGPIFFLQPIIGRLEMAIAEEPFVRAEWRRMLLFSRSKASPTQTRNTASHSALEDKMFRLGKIKNGRSEIPFALCLHGVQSLTVLSLATRFAAQAPQARNTTPRPSPVPSGPPWREGRFAPPYLSTTSTTLSVNSSHPLLEWDPASLARTVRLDRGPCQDRYMRL
jgi:hypothetical protein